MRGMASSDRTTRPSALPAWAALCFLASGAAGLLYEIVWSKQLAYVMGSSLHAVAAVVASFLGGLALGARVLGVPLARRGNGARTYAMLELGVGLLGVALLPLLRASDPLVGQLYRSLGGESVAFAAARFGLLVAFLLPPAALMGATLPVLVAHIERERVGAALARLYALNTLGAVVGSFAAGFVLLPVVGLAMTTYVAAALNVLVALVAWNAPAAARASAATAAMPTASEDAPSHAVLGSGSRLVVAGLFAASGFGALAFQIAWVRLFGLVFGSSVYSFSAVLGVYLLGIALGAALIGRWLERFATLTGFGLLQLGLAGSTALAVHAFPGLPQRMLEMGAAAGVDWRGLLTAESFTVAAIIGVPCMLLGAIFPVAVRLLQSRDGGHAAGTAYALNTLGTIAGSLLAGFVLVPNLGVQGTHLGAVAIAAGVGLVAAGMGWSQGARRGLAPVFVVVLLLATGLLVLTAPAWDPMVMSAGVYRPIMARRFTAFANGATDAVQRGSAPNKLVYYREGINASVILGTDAQGQDLWLRVGGKVDASTTDMETQALLGLIPGALADSGARTLVIGLGSGVTAAAVLATGVGPTEVVELEPGVVAASRWFHGKGEDPLDDPRTTLVMGDARTHLLHSAGRYGLIVSEPSNPWIAGVNNLFTVDFYERVKARLEPDGVFCQWLQLYELSPETFSTLVRSFREVFPHGQLFYVWRGLDLLLVACPDDRRLDRARLETSAVRRILDRARLPEASVLASYWLGPLSSLTPPVAQGALNRDDRPVVEYRAPQDLVAIGRTDAGHSTAVTGAMPFADARPEGALFADWPVGEWYLQRARWRVLNEDLPHGAQVARAARAHAPEVAAVVEAEVQRGERRAKSALAYNEAVQALATGDKSRAREALERAVAIDPDNGAAWVVLSDRRRVDGDVAGAEAAIAQARRSDDPRVRADAEAMTGMVASGRKDYATAIGHFREAERLYPASPRTYLYEAEAHLQRGDAAAGVDALKRGLAAVPNSPELAQALARVTGGR